MKEMSSGERAATAEYIEDILIELKSMSLAMDCDFLGYLLGMAEEEAGNISRKPPSARRIKPDFSARDH
mgnify:CR=1 FL=1